MKKSLTITALVNLGIIVLAGAANAGNVNDFFVVTGLTCLLLCLANLVIGILLLLISISQPRLKEPGLACLLFSALTLIGGFTLCSNASLNVH